LHSKSGGKTNTSLFFSLSIARASLALKFKGSFKAAESLATEGAMQIQQQQQKYPRAYHVGIKGIRQACL